MVSSPLPSSGLQLVIDFVNTLDVESGTDAIAGPAALTTWLVARGLLGAAGGRLGAPELARAVELREALRAAMLAHNDRSPSPGAAAVLEQVSERGRLSVTFGDDGSVLIEPRTTGFDGALAGLLVPVSEAAMHGTWQRVKACRADGCRWAFYDHSRNRSGRWCDMAVCGNRTKVKAYRKRGETG